MTTSSRTLSCLTNSRSGSGTRLHRGPQKRRGLIRFLYDAFSNRVLFIKDVIGSNEICCWSFYGHGKKIAEVCCTAIVYATERKNTKVYVLYIYGRIYFWTYTWRTQWPSPPVARVFWISLSFSQYTLIFFAVKMPQVYVTLKFLRA